MNLTKILRKERNLQKKCKKLQQEFMENLRITKLLT